MEIIYYRHNKYLPQKKMDKCKIQFYELTFILDGETTYNIDGKDYYIKTGDGIFLSPNQVRYRQEIDKVNYCSFNFLCDESPGFPTVLNDCLSNAVIHLIQCVDDVNKGLCSSDKKCDLLLETVILQIKAQIEESKFNPVVLKIKRYLEENFDKKITLKDVSNLTFFSPIYCDSVFKKETGKSIIDYLINVRISYAINLLIEGVTSLTDIAEKSGFSSYYYFSRIFKKRTGYSPLQYKKTVSK